LIDNLLVLQQLNQGVFMKRHTLLCSALLGSACLAVNAQSMKPGLWEINTHMQSSSGQMEKGMAQMQAQMASMPPEQRKMMMDMMAKQGVNMGAGAPGAMSVKVCLTKEMTERNQMPAQNPGDCKQTVSPRVGNTMTVSFTCTKPPSSGEGQVTFISPEAYTTKMTVNSAMHGKSEQMKMDSSGKWMGADCGSIKPLVR
jgi:Protein of unknown function (DUF3617)